MTKDEALDKALNALLWANIEINDWRDDAHGYKPEDQPQIMEAITAIKQARSAQQEHEPENEPHVSLASVQEPVRIYDYVWPQRDEHKEECVYACNYTPGHHLARGELLAVVHPSQLISTYLQRDNEAAHGIASPAAQRQWVGLTAKDRKEIERQSVYVEGAIRMTETKLKEKNT